MEYVASEFSIELAPRFVQRKNSADVFNKWVFQVIQSRDGDGSRGQDSRLDPVIPSGGLFPMQEYVRRQILALFSGDDGRLQMGSA